MLRYRVDAADDGLSNSAEGTFTICSFWLVAALATIGETDRARRSSRSSSRSPDHYSSTERRSTRPPASTSGTSPKPSHTWRSSTPPYVSWKLRRRADKPTRSSVPIRQPLIRSGRPRAYGPFPCSSSGAHRPPMPNAVVLTRYGPPDVLAWSDVPYPEPGPGERGIRVRAASGNAFKPATRPPAWRRSGMRSSRMSGCTCIADGLASLSTKPRSYGAGIGGTSPKRSWNLRRAVQGRPTGRRDRTVGPHHRCRPPLPRHLSRLARGIGFIVESKVSRCTAKGAPR